MASGMCADFNPKDSSFYIVGTEEGSVHRCSVSYNEQVRGQQACAGGGAWCRASYGR